MAAGRVEEESIGRGLEPPPKQVQAENERKGTWKIGLKVQL